MPERASLFHEESSHVAKNLILPDALARRHSLKIIEVDASDTKLGVQIGRLAIEGYAIHFFYAYSPCFEAARPVAERFLKTRRWLPIENILDIAARIEASWADIRLDSRLREYVLYDMRTSNGTRP